MEPQGSETGPIQTYTGCGDPSTALVLLSKDRLPGSSGGSVCEKLFCIHFLSTSPHIVALMLNLKGLQHFYGPGNKNVPRHRGPVGCWMSGCSVHPTGYNE